MNSLGQNISSRLHKNEFQNLRLIKTINKVVIKSVFYGTSGKTESRTEAHYFNKLGKSTNGEYLNLETNVKGGYFNEYLNDSLLIKRSSYFHSKYSNEKSVLMYEYDEHIFLIKVTKIEGPTDIYKSLNYVNDDFGNPTKLIINEGEFGYEIAEYDYPNNIANLAVYDRNNNLLSKSSLTIDLYKKNTENEYNDLGDVISSSNYIFEYKYDKVGNWIQQIRFKKDGKKKDAVFTRKIFYNK